MPIPHKIYINSEFIKLGQFLKFSKLVESGGRVKEFLFSHTITINQKLETQRGKKLFINDMIEIDNQSFLLCKE
jgi:ribosome-associated protein YbcJ (S4-like RNA binding protein)